MTSAKRYPVWGFCGTLTYTTKSCIPGIPGVSITRTWVSLSEAITGSPHLANSQGDMNWKSTEREQRLGGHKGAAKEEMWPSTRALLWKEGRFGPQVRCPRGQQGHSRKVL